MNAAETRLTETIIGIVFIYSPTMPGVNSSGINPNIDINVVVMNCIFKS